MGQSPLTRGFALNPTEGPVPDPHIARAFARTIAYRLLLYIYEHIPDYYTHDPGVERSSYVVRQFIVLTH